MTPKEAEPIVPIPKSQILNQIDEDVERRWNRRWSQKQAARQTRLFWPAVNRLKSLQMLRLDRQDYGEVVRLTTGHNYLNRHRFLLGETESEECRLCMEAEESSEHIFCECPVLDDIRFQAVGHRQVNTEVLGLMPFDSYRRFTLLIRRKLISEGLEKI